MSAPGSTPGRILAAALAIALGGCDASTASLSGLKPVMPAKHDAIVTEYQTFVGEFKQINADPDTDAERAKLYVYHGYDLSERACLLYFTRLRQLRNDTTFLSDSLGAVFAAGGIVAALSGVASPVLVGLFAGAGLVPSTIQSFNNIYLLAAVGDDLYPTITQTMATYRNTHQQDSPVLDVKGTAVLDKNKTPVRLNITRWNAQQLVQEYASLC